MNSIVDDDKGIPKLRSYLAAILDVKEKNLSFLPCYNGYLIFVDTKKPYCVWVHESTIEGVLKAGFDIFAEEFLFKLIWGGKVLKELLKGVLPETPKNTLVFYPGLHRVIHGTINPEVGTTGPLLKGINKATDIVQKTSKGILNTIIPSNEDDKSNENITKEQKDILLQKTYNYLQFQDFLYTTLSKEKLFKQNIPISSGYEFRSVYQDEANQFIKLLQKGGFITENKGKRGLI